MLKNIQGAGDVVATITKLAGIQPCEACQKRREKWNKLFPLRVRKNIREMTGEELSEWRAFQQVRTLRLTAGQRIYICRIYSEVFSVPYYEPCATCDPSPYLAMIEKMDAVVKTYEEV
jgi:hypothetical protein